MFLELFLLFNQSCVFYLYYYLFWVKTKEYFIVGTDNIRHQTDTASIKYFNIFDTFHITSRGQYLMTIQPSLVSTDDADHFTLWYLVINDSSKQTLFYQLSDFKNFTLRDDGELVYTGDKEDPGMSLELPAVTIRQL